uniref:(northern house mosquito) hypothetical protein n=1 Tax=Culex pipiens TaxID=7175 RepID=A0A8D8F3D9_CULPI
MVRDQGAGGHRVRSAHLHDPAALRAEGPCRRRSWQVLPNTEGEQVRRVRREGFLHPEERGAARLPETLSTGHEGAHLARRAAAVRALPPPEHHERRKHAPQAGLALHGPVLQQRQPEGDPRRIDGRTTQGGPGSGLLRRPDSAGAARESSTQNATAAGRRARGAADAGGAGTLC